MPQYARAMTLIAVAIIGFGGLTACSEAKVAATPVSAVPDAANYIADLTGADGTAMTMAIAVEGDKAVAYATNGINDATWFVGSKTDRGVDLTSVFRDRLQASLDGSTVSGTVTMNAVDPSAVAFAATRVAAPAGIYTASLGDARASWIVRPDQPTMGVMDSSAPGDHKVTDQLAEDHQRFLDSVRQMRIDMDMRPAPPLMMGTWGSRMNGEPVIAAPVTGNMRMSR